jgi:signal transduction histidine kinase
MDGSAVRILYLQGDARAFGRMRQLSDSAADRIAIDWVWSAYEATEALSIRSYDAVVVDSSANGVEAEIVISEIRGVDAVVPIVVLGSGDDGYAVARAMRADADELLEAAAFSVERLVAAVRSAGARRSTRRQNNSLCAKTDELLRAEETLKRREEQLRKAQQMEAVGQLAGGIAHDFNNILTAIRGYTDMVRLELDRSHPLQYELREVISSVDRAADLTRQLLAFSRRQMLNPKPLDVTLVLHDMDAMVRRLAGEHIEVTMAIDDAAGMVVTDRAQLERALINLVLNARDAMPDGGLLSIDIANQTLDDAFVAAHPGSSAGDHLRIRVSDSGVGMTDDVRHHIFEPFFTTKPIGQGTGLGMATVYGIVKQSGGYIAVDSAPQRGTRVSIYLPLRDVSRGDGPHATPVATPAATTGGSTVLLVEDSSPVRTVMRRGLESAGFTVVEAVDGQDAVEMARRPGFHADVIVSDLVMPRLGGGKMVEALRELGVELPVVFMSGYASEDIIQRVQTVPESELIEKPFTTAALTTRVQKVLESRAARV